MERGLGLCCIVCLACLPAASAQSRLEPQQLLQRETFWDNRDWDWYLENIPFFECPDPELQTTYYYRWELITKHLTYGSPNSGYSFTEFIDRPFWSGAYGAIVCPAGHQLYETRWLRDPTFARDYARYWFRTPGAEPRRYSSWLVDAIWQMHRVHPSRELLVDLLPDLVRNYEGWEREHWVPELGLFWQTGHDDGMEFNINSRQTADECRGAPAYRPTLNAYLCADARAIARVAELAGDAAAARAFLEKADGIQQRLLEKLWEPQRQFFFPLSQREERSGEYTVQALTPTHRSGRHAGSPYGRELIGYVPWQFGLVPVGQAYDAAWQRLTDPQGFDAPFGPTTVERRDPMFLLQTWCCWWSGQSWPYATSQTLKALAEFLQAHPRAPISRQEYTRLLGVYARTHRKEGRPYLAEACHPDTGSFEGHDGFNHSEHYFHSSFNDLVITGLVGLRPRDDETLEIHPLAPADWPFLALVNVPYRGRTIDVYWDREGNRYGLGQGLHVLVDGRPAASSQQLERLELELPAIAAEPAAKPGRANFAVNNDGTYYPRLDVSFSSPAGSPQKAVDGNAWYHISPPNRWTCEGSPNESDWIAIDFGRPRTIDTVRLFFLDDGQGVAPPQRFDLESWDGAAWKPIAGASRQPAEPAGRRANVVRFPAQPIERLRATLHHSAAGRAGLTEFEAWGEATRPVETAPHPAANLAYNPGDRDFPKATASHHDRFGGVPALAIDGRVNYLPNPLNRWTSYESPNEQDWLEIDFGQPRSFASVELAIFDDRGGVQAPARFIIEYWDGAAWHAVAGETRQPEKPIGGQLNRARFDTVRASKIRVVMTHAGTARSGLSEIFVWAE